METDLIIIILNVVMAIIFIIIVFLSRKYIPVEVSQTEFHRLKKKIEMEIEQKSEERAQKAEISIKDMNSEQKTIDHGGKIFSTFNIDLKSAMPKNRKELKKDMTDLMETVKKLEGFDKEQYIKEDKTGPNVGTTMFLDRISSRLLKIMKKEKLDKEPILIFDKLVYIALKNINNISRSDIMDCLEYMKEAEYVQDYIEINPQLTIISQMKKEIKFSNPEKVVLVFAQDENKLTFKKLMENSKWSKSYAKKVVNGLVKNGIAEIFDDVIKIRGFETEEEKKLRNNIEKEKSSTRKQQLIEDLSDILDDIPELEQIEQPVEKKEMEILEEKELKRMADQTAKAERIKKFKKPSVKALPITKTLKKTSIKKLKIIKKSEKVIPKPAEEVELTEDEITGIDEKLKKKITQHQEFQKEIKKTIAEQDVENEDKFDISDVDFSDIGTEFVEDGDSDEELNEEAIIDGIMTIFEKYEIVNGGLMDIKLIHQFLKELYTDISIDELIGPIKSLKQMGLVRKEISLGSLTILLFKDIELNDDMLEIIKVTSIKGQWMTKDELSDALGSKWNEERTLNGMKNLQDIGVLRLDIENKVEIPGLYIIK
ncbi:MAG: hypothetical protein ACTSWY_12500 [Promethearchaeota archaeon]